MAWHIWKSSVNVTFIKWYSEFRYQSKFISGLNLSSLSIAKYFLLLKSHPVMGSPMHVSLLPVNKSFGLTFESSVINRFQSIKNSFNVLPPIWHIWKDLFSGNFNITLETSELEFQFDFIKSLNGKYSLAGEKLI